VRGGDEGGGGLSQLVISCVNQSIGCLYEQ